jgi:D-glycero-D-manno-heptose 1,7-bisphosphate phosphatase
MPSTSTGIFFDRDGIVNRRLVDDYVTCWKEFELLDDILELLPSVHAIGAVAILVTNQRGISLGRMSHADLDDIHRQLQRTLRDRCGHAFDAIYFCPHGNDDGCSCRKPKPGMILHGLHEFDLDPSHCWMIGDAPSDIEAGRAAGCRTAFVGAEGVESGAEIAGGSLRETWEKILRFYDEAR